MLTGGASRHLESYEEAVEAVDRFGTELATYDLPLHGVLVGGVAYWAHLDDGKEPVLPTAKDVDLYIPDDRVVDAVIDTDHGIDVSERYNGGAVYQLGEDREPLPAYRDFYRIKYGNVVTPPVVDILTEFSPRVTAMLDQDLQYGERLGITGEVRLVSRDTFLAMKEAAGRKKDIEQVASLLA